MSCANRESERIPFLNAITVNHVSHFICVKFGWRPIATFSIVWSLMYKLVIPSLHICAARTTSPSTSSRVERELTRLFHMFCMKEVGEALTKSSLAQSHAPPFVLV
jgi:hypothetical protein